MPQRFPVFRIFYFIYAFVIFAGFMLLILPFVAIAAIFGRVKGGNIIVRICRFWADCILFLGGFRQEHIFLTPHDSKKQYVFVVNHMSYTDSPTIIKAIRGQHFRVLGKVEMTRFPIFGFIYRNATVMVDRKSAYKRAQSVYQLKKFIAKGISVVIFPEGTFNETGQPLKSFYDGAFRIAIETQTTIKPILLLDTQERLNPKSLLSLNPGRSRVVFMDEVPVEGLTLKDVKLLKDKVRQEMENHLLFLKA